MATERIIQRLLARIDLRAIGARLDAALQPVEGLDVPGQVFLAREKEPPRWRSVSWEFRTSIEEVLSEEEQEALFAEIGVVGTLERILGDGFRWEVRCWNPSSMVSGVWGMRSLVLGERGYFCMDDTEFDSEFPLFGAWAPADSQETYEAAFVETYVASWDSMGLPPYRGQVVDGPRDLILRAHERILPTEPSWAYAVAEALAEEGSDWEEWLVPYVAETMSLPEETVAAVLRAAAQGDLYEGIDEDTRRRLLREAYFALW